MVVMAIFQTLIRGKAGKAGMLGRPGPTQIVSQHVMWSHHVLKVTSKEVFADQHADMAAVVRATT